MQQNLDFSIKNVNKLRLFRFLNEVCFIPNKSESEESFLIRVNHEFPGGIKQIETLLGQRAHNIPYIQKILSKIDIHPRFLPWVISKKGLRPWHLGVFETIGNRHRIQIHPRSVKSLKLIEVLTHEAIHYLRKDLKSPYEELLCYLASRKKLYRVLGFYLVSWECRIALLLSFLVSLLPIGVESLSLLRDSAILSQIPTEVFPVLSWSSPFLLLGSFFLCRFRMRAPFHLLKRFSQEKISSPLSLLLRLQEEEINTLAKAKSPQVKMQSTIQLWAKTSFRWKFLESIYLTKEKTS